MPLAWKGRKDLQKERDDQCLYAPFKGDTNYVQAIGSTRRYRAEKLRLWVWPYPHVVHATFITE